MGRIKLAIACLLGGLLVIFAVQNMASVELTFFVWSFQSRRFVVIGVSVLVGLVVGWIIGLTHRRARQSPDSE
jgi:uncharacterized integral membrane protein